MMENMESTNLNSEKESQEKEDKSHGLRKNRKRSGESELESESMVRRGNPENSLIYVNQLRANKISEKTLAVFSIGLGQRIPKQLVSINQKYLRCCLESIHFSALKAVPCNISLDLSSIEMSVFKSENMFGSSKFIFEYPLVAGDEGLVVRSTVPWIVGSIMGSKSMENILKSPLMQQFGALDSDSNLGTTYLNDVKCLKDLMSSPDDGSSVGSKHKLESETSTMGLHKFGSTAARKIPLSLSSTNSTCSDQSSTSATASVSQGMLHCSWKDGIPHFVFSVDDKRKVYVANLCRTEATDDRVLNYVYYFYSRRGEERERDIHDDVSHLIGKMTVSTSITLCPNNSNLTETEFVLFANNENYVGEMQASSHKLNRNKGFSKKMTKMFRTNHSTKQKTISKSSLSSSLLEVRQLTDNVDTLDGVNFLENHLTPNFELAAIIVKEHLPDRHKAKVGGWGLNFLKKVAAPKQPYESLETCAGPECCATGTSDCSTTVDIIVPAGLHGGPKSRNGGPSSLTERWKSGGRCDCGGWDMGCPITVLKNGFSKEEVSSLADTQGKCKSSDFFIQGSECGSPTLRMVHVHDDLYFIHFHSTLSALQSFSIAVASIHARSPTLRPKSVQEVK